MKKTLNKLLKISKYLVVSIGVFLTIKMSFWLMNQSSTISFFTGFSLLVILLAFTFGEIYKNLPEKFKK